MIVPKEFKIVFAKIKDKRKLYLGGMAAVLAAIIVSFVPYIYGRLVDIAVSPHSQTRIIAELIALWLFLSFVDDALSRYSQKQAVDIATDATDDLLVDIFHHLIDLPMAFHKKRKVGKIMRSIDRGIDDLYNLIENTVFNFMPSVLSFFVALAILLAVEWRLALVLVATTAAYILATLAFAKEIVKRQRAMHLGWEKAYGVLWDSVLNVQTVKATTNEEFERRRNDRNFTTAGRIYEKWRYVWLKMGLWQRMILTISFVAVLSGGILMLRAGTLTAGKLIMFVGYTSLLTSPLSQLANQYQIAKRAVYSFKRAMRYYEIVPESDLPGAEPLDVKGAVVFDSVSFGYQKGQMTLKDVSFRVRPGETVALVGESGVGKTTLVDLLGRYYLPKRGGIFIDGVPIEKIKLKSLRAQMAAVPQEVLLFNDKIRSNICYGRESATHHEIAEAAKAANAHEFIETFPKKYDQIVGERGIKLSTGQKQRVAIARAILRNPRILILDEATSALDSVSEKLVQEALNRLIKGRTTFVIAHRLSTIQNADKIIVLQKGRIAEMGTHVELMRHPKGIYRNFWELQSAIHKAK